MPPLQSGFDKAYSFLDDYRQDELNTMTEEIRKTKGTKNEYKTEHLKVKASKLVSISWTMRTADDPVLNRLNK